MPLETPITYISDLNSSNPTVADGLNQGDDHLRGIKAALKTTFPNINGAVTATQAQLNLVSGYAKPWVTADYTDASITTVKLADKNVTYAKFQDVAAAALLGNTTGAPASAQEIALGTGLQFNAGALRITANSLTYALMQNVSASALLGNPTGAAAVPAEITLGAGLQFSGTALTAPAQPVPGLFFNKKIKVTDNTHISVTCDWLSVTDGTSSRRVAINSTSVNLGLSGAINQLATGLSITAATWYAVWGVCKADGTLAGVVVDTNFSTPTLPTGYTMYGYMGAVRTAAAVASLMGTWQLGRSVRYIVGLAQTTVIPVLANGAAGTWDVANPIWAAVSVSSFVPVTASVLCLAITNNYKNNALSSVQVAPNGSYAGSASAAGNWCPIQWNVPGDQSIGPVTMLLESTNIYWTSSGAGGALACAGWDE